MRIKNIFYKRLEWEKSLDGKMLAVEFDPDVLDLKAMQILPIDDTEQSIIDDYDTASYQQPEHTIVWFVEWPNGEWEPRGTYTNYEDAKADADSFWREHTQRLSEKGYAAGQLDGSGTNR